MDIYTLEQDTVLLCVTAVSFPEGIVAAFDTLHRITTNTGQRKLYGISRPGTDRKTVYRAAAAEKYPGEAAALGCESFVVKKGNYYGILVTDFMQNIPAIGAAFSSLLAQPGIDPEGYCLEIYEGATDVRCLVPIKA